MVLYILKKLFLVQWGNEIILPFDLVVLAMVGYQDNSFQAQFLVSITLDQRLFLVAFVVLVV